jgi:hypothetical protein
MRRSKMTGLRKALCFFLPVAALAGMSGCRTFSVKTPDGFVKYRRTSTYYRAVSPENSLIVVRSRENDPRGSLSYWAETLKRDLTKVRGYKLLDESKVENAQGKEGVQMRFNGAFRGRMFTYYISVFVTNERIFTVETLAEKDHIDRRKEAFQKAVASMKIL